MLSSRPPICFVPTRDAAAARTFYEETLGLRFESDDGFALVFRLGPEPGTMLRIVRIPEFTPAPYTTLGWETDDIASAVDELAAKGITFLRFGYFEQDERGVWHTPGASVAWFHDPDGNTLSLSQHKSDS